MSFCILVRSSHMVNMYWYIHIRMADQLLFLRSTYWRQWKSFIYELLESDCSVLCSQMFLKFSIMVRDSRKMRLVWANSCLNLSKSVVVLSIRRMFLYAFSAICKKLRSMVAHAHPYLAASGSNLTCGWSGREGPSCSS